MQFVSLQAYDFHSIMSDDETPLLINHTISSPLPRPQATLRVETKSQHVVSTWQQRLLFMIDQSLVGQLWEFADSLVNLAFCSLYIVNTYYYVGEHRDDKNDEISASFLGPRTRLPHANMLADLILTILLLVLYIPRLFLATEWRSVLNPICFATFLSALPVLMAYFHLEHFAADGREYMGLNNYAWLYPIRFFRLHLAIMSSLAPSKTSVLNVSMITRKSIRLIGFLLFLIITVAGFIHMDTVMNAKVSNISFFDAFYFAFVSATSGSPSSVIPDSPTSRFLVVGVIITALTFIPTNLAELLSLISKKSKYDHRYKYRKNQNHVVVCGEFETSSIRTFLKEFFCLDHGSHAFNTLVLLLNPKEPSEDLQLLLSDPKYVNRVQYIKGSCMNSRSLEKVRIKEANAVFVLSSKQVTEEATEEDANSVMRCLAMKKTNPWLKIYVQVLLPEHKQNFKMADGVICTEELKMGIFAQTCRLPGFVTLLKLLTTSISENSTKKLDRGAFWMKEYLHGLGQEIYFTRLSFGWHGYQFNQMSLLLYEKFQVCVIGVLREGKVELNPDTVLVGSDVIILIGGVQEICETIENYDPDQIVVEFSSTGETKRCSDGSLTCRPNMSNLSVSNQLLPTLDKVQSEEDKEAITVEDHVIICSLTYPHDLEYFLNPLRLEGDDEIIPILVLTPRDTARLRAKFFKHKHVYFLQGDPTKRENLVKANISKARKAIILSNSKKMKPEKTADSQSLLILLQIQSMCDIPVLIEFIHEDNIAFVGKYHSELLIRPCFTSGLVYAQSMLDTLICQNYFNPYILEIVDRLIFSAESRVWFISASSFEGTYGELYPVLIQLGSLPLGLYRMNEEGQNYVYANPVPKTKLRDSDFIYVLAKRKPKL